MAQGSYSADNTISVLVNPNRPIRKKHAFPPVSIDERLPFLQYTTAWRFLLDVDLTVT
jgi:hypothetical protein